MAQNINWIAVDWGTSSLRAWAMGEDGRVLDKISADCGMGQLQPAQFEGALLAQITPWLGSTPIPVLACGMVGAKQGWVEAPYATAPCAPQASVINIKTQSPKINMHIIGGVKQTSPADVMRGEETQIAGFIRLNPNWDGVICLPGTHTKWVHISAGEIVSFNTYMTGEVFALLSAQSVLRHSLTGDDWDSAEFDAAVDDAMSRPAALSARLFSIRAEGLVNGLPNGAAKARLSGLLIGAELAAARPYWLGQSVAIIGANRIAQHYQSALEKQGVPVLQTDAQQMTIAGLKSVYAQLKGAGE